MYVYLNYAIRILIFMYVHTYEICQIFDDFLLENIKFYSTFNKFLCNAFGNADIEVVQMRTSRVRYVISPGIFLNSII